MKKNRYRIKHHLHLFGLLLMIPAHAAAQLYISDTPLSFDMDFAGKEPSVLRLEAPDKEQIIMEDMQDESYGFPRRMAVMVSCHITPSSQGLWEEGPNGARVWRLRLEVAGAKALSLYFDRFNMLPDHRLFIYSGDRSQVLGAFGAHNNNNFGLFATGLIRGDALQIELNMPWDAQAVPDIRISEVGYAYRDTGGLTGALGFGDSGPCEVNLACNPEGDAWNDVKNGVVRIQCKVGGGSYWCTGALVNNTLQDMTPYVLTADHCAWKFGHYASVQDLAQWIFYFGFESNTCDNPLQSPVPHSLTGAVKIAQGGDRGENGSDFYLVELIQPIPTYIPVAFLGWNRAEFPAQSGVCIHHPEGDIKKISTFTSPLQSVAWTPGGPQAHWKVFWAETQNGHGVTEPGSSGSPLLDDAGRMVGTLTGGQASCTGTDLPDFFGKFSYHWQSNGSHDTLQLMPWLDPTSSGILQMDILSDNECHWLHPSGIFPQLYPVPASDLLSVDFTGMSATEYQCLVTDLAGRKRMNFRIAIPGIYHIKVSDLPPGMYFLAIRDNRNLQIRKFVIK
ncbi:MAG: T9SS type A sorting domain-containing protein [Bacteroidales bacterium]|nr:T9SS type A sorting domain-containing protein [Bacteroidales bacterium]